MADGRWLTVEEAALLTRRSKATIWRWVRNNEVYHARPEQTVMVWGPDVMRVEREMLER